MVRSTAFSNRHIGLATMSRSSAAIWLTIAFVAAIDLAWIYALGMRLNAGSLFTFVIIMLPLVAIAVYYHVTGRSATLAAMAHTLTQFFSFFAVAGVFSYLAATIATPLIDDTLSELDRMIGLNWVTWFEWVQARPVISAFLNFMYGTSGVQIFFCIILFSVTGRYESNRELLWIIILSLLITIPLSGVFPAESAWIYYDVGHLANVYHIEHFGGLREGAIQEIDLRSMTGIVTFPSFHTALAIALTYVVRRHRLIFIFFASMNLLVLLSVPTAGGHYFVDVPAGAAVAAIAIAGARRLETVLHGFPEHHDSPPVAAAPVLNAGHENPS